VFIIDISEIVQGALETAFLDPAGFRGAISIGQCTIPTPPKTAQNRHLAILVTAPENIAKIFALNSDSFTKAGYDFKLITTPLKEPDVMRRNLNDILAWLKSKMGPGPKAP